MFDGLLYINIPRLSHNGMENPRTTIKLLWQRYDNNKMAAICYYGNVMTNNKMAAICYYGNVMTNNKMAAMRYSTSSTVQS